MDVMKRLTIKKKKIDIRLKGRPNSSILLNRSYTPIPF
jgi:hypothetical protein